MNVRFTTARQATVHAKKIVAGAGVTPNWVSTSHCAGDTMLTQVALSTPADMDPTVRALRNAGYRNVEASEFATIVYAGAIECPNPWHQTASLRRRSSCPECSKHEG
jgi:hypothetical protein